VLYFLDLLLTILQCFTLVWVEKFGTFPFSQAYLRPVLKLLDIGKKKKKFPKLFSGTPSSKTRPAVIPPTLADKFAG
jgi:hypothetical protein